VKDFPTNELVAVWDETEIPIAVGQPLLGLRTHTGNLTMYLYDFDGERPGWVSGDIFSALEWEPDANSVYALQVLGVVRLPAKKTSRIRVRLWQVADSSTAAARLRKMGNWPNSLGEEPGDLAAVEPILHAKIFDNTPSLFANPSTQPSERTTMNTVNKSSSFLNKSVSSRLSRTVDDNTGALKNASYFEAGNIVNEQLAKIVSAKAPLMVRGYVNTPIGTLVIANLFKVLVHELRGDNAVLQRLSDASMEAAYVDLVRTLRVDELIDELLSIDSIKRAMSKVGGDDAA
jgi:hypothetical protein